MMAPRVVLWHCNSQYYGCHFFISSVVSSRSHESHVHETSMSKKIWNSSYTYDMAKFCSFLQTHLNGVIEILSVGSKLALWPDRRKCSNLLFMQSMFVRDIVIDKKQSMEHIRLVHVCRPLVLLFQEKSTEFHHREYCNSRSKTNKP